MPHACHQLVNTYHLITVIGSSALVTNSVGPRRCAEGTTPEEGLLHVAARRSPLPGGSGCREPPSGPAAQM